MEAGALDALGAHRPRRASKLSCVAEPIVALGAADNAIARGSALRHRAPGQLRVRYLRSPIAASRFDHTNGGRTLVLREDRLSPYP